MKSLSVFAPECFPMVKKGDDIADVILDVCKRNRFELQDGDIIVIAQKIFSKAEGRIVRIRDVVPSTRSKELGRITKKDPRFVELILRETRKILKVTSDIFLVEDKRGLVCINAGIDKSNIEGSENFALLPENPDLSARTCRSKMERATGVKLGVVICDTYSRPFRRGQVNFAIGVAGLGVFRDYRGKKDLFGNVLKVKNVGVVDEIAAAAELLMGQGRESTPVIILRGLNASVQPDVDSGMGDLLISDKEDLFKGIL